MTNSNRLMENLVIEFEGTPPSLFMNIIKVLELFSIFNQLK